MFYGLQAGFGHPLGADMLGQIRALGFDAVRLDCQDLPADTRAALIAEATEAGLIALVIVRDATQLDGVPAGSHIEIRSEPDIHTHASFGLDPSNAPVTPAEYLALIEAAYSEAKSRVSTLWAGTVSNLNERGLDYLEALCPREWPPDLPVSIHWYPHGDPRTAHPGFESREAEMARFKSIIGERQWGLSEFGYHTGPRRYCYIFTRRWTDAQVAEHTTFEWQFWQRHGATFAVAYQLNDGLTDTAIDSYGIRTVEGAWKPVARTVAATKAAHA